MMNEWSVNKYLVDHGYECTKIYKNKLTYFNKNKNKFLIINSKSIFDIKTLEKMI